MPQEVPATLKLYLNGTIEQMWFRDQAGPVFLMNAESVAQAKTAIDALPPDGRRSRDHEYMPLSPLMPLGMLIRSEPRVAVKPTILVAGVTGQPGVPAMASERRARHARRPLPLQAVTHVRRAQ